MIIDLSVVIGLFYDKSSRKAGLRGETYTYLRRMQVADRSALYHARLGGQDARSKLTKILFHTGIRMQECHTPKHGFHKKGGIITKC